MPSPLHNPTNQTKKSILNAATIQALHRTISKRLGNALRKLPDIGVIEEIREAEIGVDDVRVQEEEVLANRAEARILVAEGGDEDGRVAVVVELVVDAPLGQDGALVLREGGAHLGLQTVLEEEAGLDVGARGQD